MKIKNASYRIIQGLIGTTIRILPIPVQTMVTGKNSILKIPSMLQNNNIIKLLLVCSHSVYQSGLLQPLLDELQNQQISYTIFDHIKPNPTVENVEEGYKLYIKNHCQAIVAIGGGSPIDCAKIIGIKITNHNLSYEKMKRIYPIQSPMPPFFAIPTTAGSGTESTIAAVISEPATHSKYAISSPLLMPSYVVLDPMLTISLPDHITATTGMDALTHALEAYLGTIGSNYTNRQALKALKLIFNNLVSAYLDGSNIKVRAKLLYASNYAANAFTRALVGYVHSISHALSALYDVSHGLTNAIILPYVLEYYGTSIHKKLARIAIYTGIGRADQSEEILAKLVIERIKEMNETMGIFNKIPQIRKEDIPTIATKALKEANPLYPVPKIMDASDCEKLLLKLCE